MPVDHLIDISSYNAVHDWNAVRANGIVGASIKVSQQVNYLNPLCGAQAAGARSAGIAPGGYHFGDPRVSASAQARYFVANARPHGLFNDEALAPMYDAENWEGGGLVWPSPQVLNSHIAEHIRVVREETGVQRHFVYGSLSWWQSRWLDPGVWADENVLLWIAVYNGQPGNLQGWSHPNDALHQHTSSGVVPGIPGQVDKNVTLRDRAIGDLVNRSEDDMQLTDRMLNAWGGTPTMEEVFRYIDLRATEAAEGTAAANAKLDALLGREPGTLTETVVARQLLEQGLTGQLDTLPDEQFDLLARAVAADRERRERLRSS
jgi:GH25 family lysozyme M1 (1,4-beta-N-acetylmuramidase)